MTCKGAVSLCKSLLLRRARAAGADGSWFGGLGALTVGVDEALQVGVVRAVQAYLFAPGRGDHGGVFGQAGVGADQDVRLALCDVLQLGDLVLRKVGGVGDPHRPVLLGVYGVLVADGLVVEAAVLPDGVVWAPGWGGLLVVHVSLGVPAGRADVVCLYVLGGATGGLLPGVDHGERDEPPHEQHDNRAYYKVSPSGVPRHCALTSYPAFGQNLPFLARGEIVAHAKRFSEWRRA